MGGALPLNKDAQLIYEKAKKVSLGFSVPGPAVCEELLMLSLMALGHPLYQALSKRFALSTPVFKNVLYDSLMKSRKDEPSEGNKDRERRLLQAMEQWASRRRSSSICEQDIFGVVATFEPSSNAVATYFHEIGVKSNQINWFVQEYEHIDFVREEKSAARPSAQDRPAGACALGPSPEARVSFKGQAAHPLEAYGRCLTKLARAGRLRELLHRDAEIRQVEEVLARKEQNNVILVGPPGVGKTAIVEGLAQRIGSGKAPQRLKDLEVFEIDVGALVAGTTLRGQFEERLRGILRFCEQDPRIVLFFTEIHRLIGAGGSSADRSTDAASLLKPVMTRGDLRCLGTSTLEDFYRYLEKDTAFARGFQVIKVSELGLEQTSDILKKMAPAYEQFHKVNVPPEVLEAVVEFADRYIRDRCFPGKALSLLDQSCARSSLREKEKSAARQTVAELVSEQTGVPVSQILFSPAELFKHLEEKLKVRIKGQDHALRRIVDVIQLTKYEMDLNPNRPDGVFLLAGPTGVGKTETAKTIAECLLGTEQKLIRFDMSEFTERHTVSKLIGAPPGYVGYEEGGHLTNAVRSSQYAVLLFDEIEKAHEEIYRLFLQIFDDGRLTDAKGVMVSFRHTTVFMTTNLGAKALALSQMQRLKEDGLHQYIRKTLEQSVKDFFSPEFLNRLDDILYYQPLSPETIRQITQIKIDGALERLTKRGVTIQVDTEVYEEISRLGISVEYGARFLNRTIEDRLLKPLTKRLLAASPEARLRVKWNEEGVLIE